MQDSSTCCWLTVVLCCFFFFFKLSVLSHDTWFDYLPWALRILPFSRCTATLTRAAYVATLGHIGCSWRSYVKVGWSTNLPAYVHVVSRLLLSGALLYLRRRLFSVDVYCQLCERGVATKRRSVAAVTLRTELFWLLAVTNLGHMEPSIYVL
jgi:hypothetical protein